MQLRVELRLVDHLETGTQARPQKVFQLPRLAYHCEPRQRILPPSVCELVFRIERDHPHAAACDPGCAPGLAAFGLADKTGVVEPNIPVIICRADSTIS